MSLEVNVTSLMGRFSDLIAIDKEPISVGRTAPKTSRQKLKQYTQGHADALLMMTLPVKQRRLIKGLNQKGIPVRNLIRGGFNPFEDQRPAFMRVPCRMLIEQGEFTRPQLKEALMTEFSHWTDNTAESHASIAVGVLNALKVVKKINETYHKLD
jgi:hypothetical protein